MEIMLNIIDAKKNFHDTHALNNISLKVEKNKIIGLAGPSGSGKSTLLRCIQGLEKFDAGTYICNGTPGFIFQDFQLFPHMTVLENVTYAMNMNIKWHKKNGSKLGIQSRQPESLKQKENEQKALQLLQQLGMQSKIKCLPHQLSGGQKQRVALARTLAIHPDLLLCDEPTSGLDVATIQDVVALLQTVHAMGVTMIIASHDLDFLTAIAEQILVLRNGEIIATINPKESKTPLDAVNTLKTFYMEQSS